MINSNVMLTSFLACLLASVVTFSVTPAVKSFAKKIGAIDVPKDSRRMHTVPIPRVGGLAIFAGFLVSVLLFTELDASRRAVLLGAIIIVALGVIDDVVALKARVKLLFQIIAALIPVLMGGMVIELFSNPFTGGEINLGFLSIPITVIWIVGLTNAVNFIDGLDGLACGVSGIASITMFTIAILLYRPDIALISAALAGACVGFMPFNMNPAKIFMGDTGALFLGYILATLSIQGLFKVYAVVSFAVPFIILGLPIFDTAFAVLRRLLRGQSPMHADRGHIHHRLIDMGFDQKQSVAILYVLSAIMGLSAVLLTSREEARFIILIAAVLMSFFIGICTRMFGIWNKAESGGVKDVDGDAQSSDKEDSGHEQN